MIHEPVNPLAKKLQVKPDKSWLLFNAPENYLTSLEPLPDGVTIAYEATGSFDGVQLFVKDSTELIASLKVIVPVLKPDTVFWIIYPKKSSGIKSDLEMMSSWDEPAKYELAGVAAAAVNETWTALRFRQEGQSKVSEFCNEEIKKNEYSAFIDLDNRQIILPPIMQLALEQSTNALAFYQTLSFTNKKEYVVWILSAEQEKTLNERLIKLVDKLAARKKNPSEK